MRLEPVYLVAPQPKPPTMLRRRAFLFAGASFFAGACVGGGSVLALQSASSGAPGDQTIAPNDPELEWVHSLCDDRTPIATLREGRAALYQYLPRHQEDARLWHGIHRLADYLVAQPSDRTDKQLAAELLVFLSGSMKVVGFDPKPYRESIAAIKSKR